MGTVALRSSHNGELPSSETTIFTRKRPRESNSTLHSGFNVEMTHPACFWSYVFGGYVVSVSTTTRTPSPTFIPPFEHINGLAESCPFDFIIELQQPVLSVYSQFLCFNLECTDEWTATAILPSTSQGQLFVPFSPNEGETLREEENKFPSDPLFSL